MQADVELDAIGLLCPLPVLKARKRLKTMTPGQVLCILATDPAAIVDIPHFCMESGHNLLGTEQRDTVTAYFIRHA